MKLMRGALALAALAAAAAPAAAQLQPVTLAYQVRIGGNAAGTQTVALARDGDAWARTVTLQMGPVRQTIVTKFGADFAPISYTERAEGPVPGDATIEVTGGRYRGQAHLPPQMGGDRTYDAEASAGSRLDGTDEAILAAAQLAQGQTLTIPLFNTITGAIDSVTYTVQALEPVTVPAGTFPAFRVEVAGKAVPLMMWLRQEAPHVPLRYQLVGQPVEVVLESVQ
ncbi:MAG TPA: DUF3108 domain-containing protein [Longimicrobiaceae bacterium]|nr:DUF3108 domain-containing protein [Longimicrobiaceae bacterium]